MSLTATGLGASDRARSVDFFCRPEIAVRVEKVGFTAETLLLWNFGPNVNVNSSEEKCAVLKSFRK